MQHNPPFKDEAGKSDSRYVTENQQKRIKEYDDYMLISRCGLATKSA